MFPSAHTEQQTTCRRSMRLSSAPFHVKTFCKTALCATNRTDDLLMRQCDSVGVKAVVSLGVPESEKPKVLRSLQSLPTGCRSAP